MPRLEGGLHGLKADPSARADDQDYRHGVMLPVGPAWLTVMCDAGNRTTRWAGGLRRVFKTDGTYVVEFRRAKGEGLAISIPRSKAAVIRYFHERMRYGPFVPDVP